MFSLIFVPPMLIAFTGGFCCSVLALYLGWRIGPKRNKNNVICFLGIALGVFLWIALFLPMLTSVNVSAADLSDYPTLLLYLSLVGATPSAAFPAIVFFGPGKKKP